MGPHRSQIRVSEVIVHQNRNRSYGRASQSAFLLSGRVIRQSCIQGKGDSNHMFNHVQDVQDGGIDKQG